MPLAKTQPKVRLLHKQAAPLKLEFAWEKALGVIDEIGPLLLRHWHELDPTLKLDPDLKAYLSYESAGILRIFTARFDGKLVGYVVFFVFPNLHHKQIKFAISDAFHLDPLYRDGWAGVKLLKEAEKGLVAEGVQMIFWEVMVSFQEKRGTVGKILKRMGYHLLQHTWAKRIGAA